MALVKKSKIGPLQGESGRLGTALASHAKSRFPALDVIFATGEASGTDPAKLGTARILIKPFTFDQLAAAISSSPGRDRRS
jgi:response regulator of citrate/malate metabolism